MTVSGTDDRCTYENLKPTLFNSRLLASLCNFNNLQIFVKARFTVVGYNSKISIIYHQIKFWKGKKEQVVYKKAILKTFTKLSEKTPVLVSVFK